MTQDQSWPIKNIKRTPIGTYDVQLRGGPRLSARTAGELAAAGITPPAPDINIPPEMVRAFKDAWHKADSEGRPGQRVKEGLRAALGVHVPAAPDTRTALHTLGLTDEDIAYVAEQWASGGVVGKIRDAAREVTP